MTSIREIWSKYNKGKASIEEKKKLLQAIDNNDQELDQILSEKWSSAQPGNEDTEGQHKLWDNIAVQLRAKNQKKKHFYRYGIAAGIAILVSLFLLLKTYNNPIMKVEVASGEKVKEIMLPDGSKVWIDHGSGISYPKTFTSEARNIKLNGHAFFEVAKNPEKPFLIKTEGMEVKVLGTSFDVYNFKNEPQSVSVRTGKVEVLHTRSNSKIYLEKNEKTFYDPFQETLIKVPVDSEIAIAWRNNVLHFENIPLYQAIRQIERKYDVNINCSDSTLLLKKIRAVYKNEPLDTVLSDITFVTSSTYTNMKNEIILKSN
ncbi:MULTISPECIES: FecR family protein [Flavobacteriaceae]|uniref:FecR family protein n=1 Tax=Flavobacteriaceae TaxID=49546 RepID=UPI0014924E1F|nr:MULTISPECIES: FecR family protein [Allomuricauda]MDC6367616.1 FecR family protein [Muricauda sp. AC10]